MFINLSNHPSSQWSEAQTEAARRYGDIIDMPFPIVSPQANEDEVEALADEYRQKVLDLAQGQPVTVHVMGEMTFTVSLVLKLHETGISSVASTTLRVVSESSNGVKQSFFKFIKFRKYLP